MQAVRRMSTLMSGKASLSPSRTATPQAPVIPEGTETLASFLGESKTRFLKDASEPGASQWTVSMGNEAGDLDTIASSIGFAWMQSVVNQKPTVPFMQFERADVKLRNENIYALELAGIQAESSELFCADDVPSTNLIASKFALVDHNRLGGIFLRNNPQSEVIAVVDHHEDEGLYKNTANPRLIQSSGSCASHIALLCPDVIPPELATLLLCAITIDTDGLKPGGKAEEVDRKAAAFLLKRSTYAKPTVTTSDAPVDMLSVPDDGATIHSLPLIKNLATTLAAKKEDVQNLPASDLIRRDFKKYIFVSTWDQGVPTINVGISTVSRKLKQWIGSDGGEAASAAKTWMETNDLHVLCIATSFRQQAAVEKLTPGKKSRGKHARELLFVVRSPSTKLTVDALANRLFAGIEGNSDLKATVYQSMNTDKSLGNALPKEMRYRVYKQGDASLSRKFLAPLLKKILEGAGATASDGRSSDPARAVRADDKKDAEAEVTQGVPSASTAPDGVVPHAVS